MKSAGFSRNSRNTGGRTGGRGGPGKGSKSQVLRGFKDGKPIRSDRPIRITNKAHKEAGSFIARKTAAEEEVKAIENSKPRSMRSKSLPKLSMAAKRRAGSISPIPKTELYPMRINKFLSHEHKMTRKTADALIEKGDVKINGVVAKLGDKVSETDKVDVVKKEIDEIHKDNFYYAYNKPVGIVTHSPEPHETDIKSSLMKNSGLPPYISKNLFPVGRLDKKSEGLIIVTNDGRITDRLLNPNSPHEKEYTVSTVQELPSYFKRRMETGMKIGDYITKPTVVKIINPKTFSIILTEGKRHQIRRMCEDLRIDVRELKRVRVMNIRLGSLKPNQVRRIEDKELQIFLASLGL